MAYNWQLIWGACGESGPPGNAALPNLNDMQRLRIKAHFRVEQEGDGFYAYCPDIKGIFIYCETEAEIVPAIHESVQAYIAMSRKYNDPIPPAVIVTEEEAQQHTIIPKRLRQNKGVEKSGGVLENMDLNLVYA